MVKRGSRRSIVFLALNSVPELTNAMTSGPMA